MRWPQDGITQDILRRYLLEIKLGALGPIGQQIYPSSRQLPVNLAAHQSHAHTPPVAKPKARAFISYSRKEFADALEQALKERGFEPLSGDAVVGPAPFAWRAANATRHNWARPSGNQPVSSTSRDIDPASSGAGCASGASAI